MDEVNPVLRRIDDTLHILKKKRPWLAEESGVKLGTINSWFSYDRQPSLEDAAKIAMALRVSLDWLATGQERGMVLEDDTIREIIEYLEDLRPDELQQSYGMAKLAMAMRLSGRSERDQHAG